MTATSREVGELITAIEAAFQNVARGDVTLHEAEVIDGYGTVEERRAARSLDEETDWRNVPDTSIERCSNALPHLDSVSWRFYLPAFMRLGLRRMRDPNGSLIDHAIYTLAPGSDPTLAEHGLRRYRTLDASMKAVVRRFLELAAQDDAYCDAGVAREALDQYWANQPRGHSAASPEP